MKANRLLLMSIFLGTMAPVLADQEETLLKSLEIIYLKPELRTSFDFVRIENGTALISVWRDLPPNPSAERLECTGYQWLLSGRGEKIGEGAREVFQKFTDLQSLKLELVEVEHKTKSVDGRGRLQKTEEAKPLLKMTIDRSSALGIKGSIEDIKKELRSSLEKCLKIGRDLTRDREVSI